METLHATAAGHFSDATHHVFFVFSLFLFFFVDALFFVHVFLFFFVEALFATAAGHISDVTFCLPLSSQSL